MLRSELPTAVQSTLPELQLNDPGSLCYLNDLGEVDDLMVATTWSPLQLNPLMAKRLSQSGPRGTFHGH